ncbi:MAG: hypothetical protein CVU52_05475 [Deltaproteobacteria bacterium HGW-Deltaproteobacteria-10]|nr:MAG: hypothetical protein CVU52_05475 [Deltaproteobacteria bacterium HGW-Deltaproteobacteria-10]
MGWKKFTDPKKAIEYLNNVVKLQPDDYMAYFARGFTYSDLLGQHQRAIDDYNEVIRLKPDNAAAYNNRGLAYGKLDQYQRAIEDFNEAILIKPDYAKAYAARGIAHFMQGKNNLCCRDVHKACELGDCGALEFTKGLGFCR